MKKESVLCIYTSDAEKLELLHTQKRDVLNKLNDNNHLCMFQSRCQIEENTNVIQIIPYVFIVNEKKELLLYKRKGSEERLHDLYSIGIGGHININDKYYSKNENKDGSINVIQVIEKGVRRELVEELALHCVDWTQLSLEGTLYKTNTLVDLVHLGLVYKLEIDSSNIDLNSSEIQPVWASLNEIKQLYPQLENWSRELVHIFL